MLKRYNDRRMPRGQTCSLRGKRDVIPNLQKSICENKDVSWFFCLRREMIEEWTGASVVDENEARDLMFINVNNHLSID